MSVWELQSPEALRALASRLAPFVSAVDFVGLYGDLGAGKTTFAQGLLPALGVRDEVTSPTYQLVHAHEAGNRTVYHCDFYRLGPFEEEEIGFREMCSTAVVVVEWADAIHQELPPNRLEVRIEGEGDVRRVILTGFGAWHEKLKRFEEVNAFLDRHGWGGSFCTAVKGDASVRTFGRLERGREAIMLMNWPCQPDGPPIRNGRAYCEIAHLAREGRSFVALAQWLRERAGVSAPSILAWDGSSGIYLVEDLGDDVFSRLASEGKSLRPLYEIAVSGLLAIRAASAPQELPVSNGSLYRVPDFDREALEIELGLVLEWYFKWAHKRQCPSEAASSFFAAWAPYLDWLETREKGLILRDFHSPNLLLCRGRASNERLGVIDFQDALWGHPAYDLVSLLQDARVDVPEDIERDLLAHYCAGARELEPSFDALAFRKAYAILGAQRNTKILGIFARLSMRDGKHDYLSHMPRVARYLFRDLAHPDLKPLKEWYETYLFQNAHGIEAEGIQGVLH